MSQPASLDKKVQPSELRQQNMLKLLQIENGYSVTDHTGKIWAFTCNNVRDITEEAMVEARELALDFMNDWYATKNEEELVPVAGIPE
jgi:hypothetical protein